MRLPILFLLLISLSFPLTTLAQDTVVTRGSRKGVTLKRKGLIVQWKGDSLTLSINGRERRIDNEDIVQIRTNWNEHYLAGRQALLRFQFEDAIVRFKAALTEERRPWAKHMIRARLIEAYRGTQDHMAAIQQFLAIASEDPQTRFFHLIPLAWTSSSLESAPVIASARDLAKSKYVYAQLIAASWLMNDAQDPTSRTTGFQLLETLAQDIEPRIAQLAAQQIWRTQISTANPTLVKRWQARLDQFQDDLRYGGRFVIAESLARLGDSERAAIHYLSLPILFSEQHSVIPAALYKCGKVLQNSGQAEEANRVWQELTQKYPKSFWAQQRPPQQDGGQP